MFLHAQIVKFPTPSPLGLAILLGVFLALLAAAIILEFRRRRRLRSAAADAQHDAFDRILLERRLSLQESQTLRALVRDYAKHDPLGAITTRLGFEHMIDAAMMQYAKRHTETEFRQFGIQLRDIRIQLGLESTLLGQQILSTRELEGGQQIDVTLESKENWVHFHVDDVNEAYFRLRYRGEPPLPELPAASQRIKCHLWRDEDGRYAFTTTVVAAELAPPQLTLAHTSEFKRTQSREHFRVRHDQSVTVGVLSAKLTDETRDLRLQQPVTRLRGRMTSLSAGGGALVMQQPVSRQMLLRITLDLPQEKPLEVHAKIISTMPISGGRYLLRVEFVEVDEEAMDIISRHVMRKQRQVLATRQSKDFQ